MAGPRLTFTWAAAAVLVAACILSGNQAEARLAKVSLHSARRASRVSTAITEEAAATATASGLSIASQQQESQQQAGSANPMFDRYRAWTKAYERDAREAEAAAAKYSHMTQALIGASSSPVAQAVAKEMKRLKVEKWAKAVWAFEKMLKDPASEHALQASKLAQQPYWQEYQNYKNISGQYKQAAEKLNALASADQKVADEIQQEQLSSQMNEDSAKAQTFKTKHDTLLASVVQREKRAQEYQELSDQLDEQLPRIADAAAKAGTYAAWQANPGGVPEPDKLYKYAVVPPKLENNSTK
mmetsp:Transcript_30291/g.45649  ORF Transcript_30291/g.45649 Transcript_30291/m.45649 type:complete len:299 (+) Transcript_30291:111-1007(+)|eukprot:CAMPEP_0195007158 /NCGR_PEP_ID=MMETSP0326_2-20130528/7382_1 /TAXON_ID=2866 ORGANISM="Crypthecodinium cohnii, Strain Seligo" /NCGR_SAMPLE_ID=MMETSP0326_2 /ASSEMBLY_ACC=CAM_ASM_000348 /LENGTH=298 /DNA_ID=CAMNT_0040014377 /DNA_START=46 /DNA_END=942 /DNA_ORIENTATION=+